MKAVISRFVATLGVALCLTSTAGAQSCASGVPQGGNPHCIPPNAQGSPYYVAPPKPVPLGRWITTWGAIASDVERAKVGATVRRMSKDEAETTAKNYCKAQGGENCRILFSFGNQCGALAWPLAGGRAVTAGGSSSDEASRAALALCEEVGDGCDIFYADCSLPQFQKN